MVLDWITVEIVPACIHMYSMENDSQSVGNEEDRNKFYTGERSETPPGGICLVNDLI